MSPDPEPGLTSAPPVLELSTARRRMGGAALMLCGLLLLATALSAASRPGLPALVGLLGLACLWFGLRAFRPRPAQLRLAADAIVDHRGKVVARLDDVARLDRSPFAFFKPSNGFVLLLREPAPPAWERGLYWRIGRRVGVGGATSAAQAKAFAAAIEARLVERAAAGS